MACQLQIPETGMRRLARKLVPSEIWQRTKRPYRAPIQRTFFSSAPGTDYVSELLSPGAIRDTGHFNPDAVEKLVRKAKGEGQLGEVDEMALVGIPWEVLRSRMAKKAL